MEAPERASSCAQGLTGGHALSVIKPIKRRKKLERLLKRIGGDVRNNPHIDFSKLTTAHFLRWVILPATSESGDKPLLAFESNHDGTPEQHLDELLKVGGPTLRRIYSHCEGYLPEYEQQPLAFRDYLLQREERGRIFLFRRKERRRTFLFQSYAGWTVQSIRKNAQVRSRLQELVDSSQGKGRLPPLLQAWDWHLHQMIREALGLKPPPAPHTRTEKVVGWIGKSRLVRWGVSTLLLPVLAGPAAILVYQEWRDQRRARKTVKTQTPVQRPLLEAEDRRTVQTPLTHLVDIKPGWFRFQVLKLTLIFIQLVSRSPSSQDELGASTAIHFARWIILEGPGQRRRLVFYSNYDGSWERYLGDFIDHSKIWLNAVWSNTQGFPKTWLLLLCGARDAEGFKQWVRQHQIPTQLWYSAHADKSVRNILDDIKLCSMLAAPTSPEDPQEWLGFV